MQKEIHIQHLRDTKNPSRTACGERIRPSTAKRGEQVKFCPDCRRISLTAEPLK